MTVNGNNLFKAKVLSFQNQKEVTWRELHTRQNEFQEILKILVDHEKNEQSLNLSWIFYLRQALCLCEIEYMRFFMRDMGTYLFHVVAQVEAPGASMATTWLHEDAIQAERDSPTTEPEHPANQILCLSDLYYKHTRTINLDLYEESPSEAAVNLMLSEYY